MLKIGVVLGSARRARFADEPAAWFMGLAEERTDLQFELLDLREYELPFFDEVAPNSVAPTENEAGKRWQQKLAEFDGFVIITPEYNHAPPAVLKNALDYAYVEWMRKPVSFIGYGAVGGARAVQQLRQIVNELQMAPIRAAVHIQGGDFLAVRGGDKTLDDLEYLPPLVTTMLDELAWWAATLKAGRERD